MEWSLIVGQCAKNVFALVSMVASLSGFLFGFFMSIRNGIIDATLTGILGAALAFFASLIFCSLTYSVIMYF